MKPAIAALALAGLAACASTPPPVPYEQAVAGTTRQGVAKVEVCVEHSEVKTIRLLESSGNPQLDEASLNNIARKHVEGDGCRPIDVEWRKPG